MLHLDTARFVIRDSLFMIRDCDTRQVTQAEETLVSKVHKCEMRTLDSTAWKHDRQVKTSFRLSCSTDEL